MISNVARSEDGAARGSPNRVAATVRRCRAHHPHRLLLAAGLLLAACDPREGPPPTPGDLAYHCADGHVVRLHVEAETGRAVLTTSNAALTLRTVPADMGARFALPGWEFWAVEDEALFTHPGHAQTYCRYRPWFPS
jgi:hypothetical protein